MQFGIISPELPGYRIPLALHFMIEDQGMKPKGALWIVLSILTLFGVECQKARSQADKDEIYSAWNGVKAASLVNAVPAVMPDSPEMKDSKHICALIVVIDANGVLKRITLANKTASPFDHAAITAVEQSKFEPGTWKGKPVSTRFMVWVPFLGDGQAAIPVESSTLGKNPKASELKLPKPTNTPSAEFTNEARRAHAGGTSVFQVLVGEDGRPVPLRLLAAAGMGLDGNALAALRQYRFKPATLEGEPVPYLMIIEVNFHGE